MVEGKCGMKQLRQDILELRKEISELTIKAITVIEKQDNTIASVNKLDEKVAIQNGRVYKNEADIGLLKRDNDSLKSLLGTHLTDVKEDRGYQEKRVLNLQNIKHDDMRFWYGVGIGLLMFLLSKIQWANVF